MGLKWFVTGAFQCHLRKYFQWKASQHELMQQNKLQPCGNLRISPAKQFRIAATHLYLWENKYVPISSSIFDFTGHHQFIPVVATAASSQDLSSQHNSSKRSLCWCCLPSIPWRCQAHCIICRMNIRAKYYTSNSFKDPRCPCQHLMAKRFMDSHYKD